MNTVNRKPLGNGLEHSISTKQGRESQAAKFDQLRISQEGDKLNFMQNSTEKEHETKSKRKIYFHPPT